MVLRETTDMLRPASGQRCSDVHGVILRLLPERQDWSVGELAQRIAETGITASPKEVYNTIGYLARKGRVRRVSAMWCPACRVAATKHRLPDLTQGRAMLTRISLVAGFLVLLAASAAAQVTYQGQTDQPKTADWDALGRDLTTLRGAVQQLSEGAPTLERQLTVKELTGSDSPSVYLAPTIEAQAPYRPDPSAAVTVQGTENGFLVAQPVDRRLASRWFFKGSEIKPTIWEGYKSMVATGGTVTTGFGSRAAQAAGSVMNDLSRAIESIANNPLVRLKGVRITIAVSPSLELDLEMRENAAPVAAPSR